MAADWWDDSAGIPGRRKDLLEDLTEISDAGEQVVAMCRKYKSSPIARLGNALTKVFAIMDEELNLSSDAEDIVVENLRLEYTEHQNTTDKNLTVGHLAMDESDLSEEKVAKN